MLRDLPRGARIFFAGAIALGVLAFASITIHRADLAPNLLPLGILAVLSALSSALDVQFPIATGATLTASYVVDIGSIVLYGPYASMIVGAAGASCRDAFNARETRPRHRMLFDVSCAVVTVQATGHVYRWLGGTSVVRLDHVWIPIAGAALTYFVVGTGLLAIATGLTTGQRAWPFWKSDLARRAPGYLLGAPAVVVLLSVTEASGYWPGLLVALAPLYLAYKVYQAGVRSEARQGAILEAAQDAIITMDERLRVSEFNPAAERMFGRAKRDVIGRSVEHLLPPSTRETQVDAFRRHLGTSAGPLVDRHLELRALRADGSEFPVDVTVARVGAGRHAAVTGFFRDVTGRRALEEQLRQSQKLEAIGRLASGVAHDFNNVLMSIIGSAELILMQLGPDDPLRAEAEEIKEAVRRGTDLSGQLLALGRRQAKAPKLVALGDVVGGMRTMLRRLISADINLQILCEPAKGLVMTDPGQIEQVVLNLVINARDAMPGGGELTVAVTEVGTDDPVELARVEGHAGRYVRLSVTDTGSGIDAKTRARLFEPFFSTKEQGRGTGLGLSIVHGIVKQSGGFIAVDSEPGRGSAFFVYLPLAEEQRPAAALTSSRL